MKYTYGTCKVGGLNPVLVRTKGKTTYYLYRKFKIFIAKKSYKEKYQVGEQFFRTLQRAFAHIDNKFVRNYPRLFFQSLDELENGVIDELKDEYKESND